MKILSIRALSRSSQAHEDVYNEWVRALPKQPYYRPATSLLGRIRVALSGSEARRQRACARLNSFYKSREDKTSVRQDYSNCSKRKFVKAYRHCKNSTEQELMMNSLHEEAKKAAFQALSWV